jgi:hypothetical protein
MPARSQASSPRCTTAVATRSALEVLMLDLCDRHGIVRPEVNARVARLIVREPGSSCAHW